MITMGQRIRKLRDAKGWTQAELAKEAGTGEKYISALELDRRKPGHELMAGLCRAFDITEQELRFGGAQEDIQSMPVMKLIYDAIEPLSDIEQLELLLHLRKMRELKGQD